MFLLTWDPLALLWLKAFKTQIWQSAPSSFQTGICVFGAKSMDMNSKWTGGFIAEVKVDLKEESADLDAGGFFVESYSVSNN